MFDSLDTQVRQIQLPNRLSIADHSTYDHHTARLFQPSFLRVSGPIHAPTRMDTAELGPLRLIYCRHAFDVDIEAPAFERRALLHVPLQGQFFLRSPLDQASIAPGTLLLVTPGHDVSLSFSVGSTFLVVQLPHAALLPGAGAGMLGRGLDPLRTGHFISRNPPSAGALMSLLSYLYFEAGQDRSAQERADLGQGLLGVLAQRIARCFGMPSPEQAQDDPLLLEARNFVQSQAFRDDPSVAALADHLGFSMRALQRRFSKIAGQSPQAWLLSQRLDHVHAALEGGRYPSVTQAAFASGFQDLGRFAHHYRCRFGQKPSATLRQAQRKSATSS
ncbi:MAG: AraC family transcriptional regulator [Pseudomonadota bacterium]